MRSIVKISTEQINMIVSKGGEITPESARVDDAFIRLTDAQLIKAVAAQVDKIPDRDEMVAELRAKIAAGTYKPTGDEIADTMVRRIIADRIR